MSKTTTTKEKATKEKVIENTEKSWLQAEQRYLLSRLEEKTDGWSTWESEKQLADFCSDMGEPEEKAVPQGLGDIVRSGKLALWYTTTGGEEKILALPKEDKQANAELRKVCKSHGAWDEIDERVATLLRLTTRKRNWQQHNMVIEINAGAEDELIADGLWHGTERRMRYAEIKDYGKNDHETHTQYTIWHENGTINEWNGNTCVADSTRIKAEVLRRLYKNAN